jgi:aspartyl-tRNA synthetase
MSFVEQEDILHMFEGLVRRVFKDVKNIDYTEAIVRMTWEDAMWQFGNDKPDIRFGMSLCNLKKPGHIFVEKQDQAD